MRKEVTLAASLLTLLLTLAAPAHAQTVVGESPDESFILFQDERGRTVCRVATEAERTRLRRADATHVIYRGAPLRRERGPAGERLVANAPADSTSAQLQPSAGLTIVLEGTEQLEANPEAKNAFIVAANRWEALISTPITVTLSVDYGPTFFGTPYPDSRILGQTSASTGVSTLAAVRKRLLASNPTASEAQLYNLLPTSSVPTEFNGETVEVSTIRMTTALGRAIGFLTGEGPDAQIGFNSNFGNGGQFDFDPADGITTGQIDFDSVVTHEIGHALGFISANGSSNSTVLALWDLFRFRPATAGVANFDSATRVLSKGGVQVMFGNFTGTFASQELGLSTGGPSPPAGDTDDGRQSSHWKADELVQGRPYIGVMDPTLARSLRRTISENDIRTTDLIGYSVVFDPARPANDNFASSLLIGGGEGTVTGTNLWATREPGELSTQGGLQAGFLGDKSVWYSWTAPLSGTVTFTTAGSSFDTTLGVYRGDSVSTVTAACAACESDDLADGTNTSQVQFDATAGTVYRIAVDGWNGEYGTVQLNWSLVVDPTQPTPTPTPTPAPVPGILQFSASAYSVGENGVSAAITVNRTAGSDGAVSVNYATSNGTAAAGADFTAAAGTLSFAAGETSKSFNVTVNNDSLDEPGETVSLSLSAPAGGATLGPQSTATLTILDDDAAPSLSVGDVAVNEGDTGTATAVFNVSLSQPSGQTVTVAYATADGTATAPRDYTAASGTLSFAPGETVKTVTVQVAGDAANEPGEFFFLNLSGATEAFVADAQGVGTVLNDDTPVLRFSQPSFPAAESAHSVTVTVTRTGDPTIAVSVEFATADGTASERRDYTAASGTLRFAAGETSKSFDVLLTEDAYPEADETINLMLLNPAGGALLGAPATLVIAADDNPPPPTNPINNSSDFVRQHYHDFLNREPDAPGLAFWSGEIDGCGADAQCREVKRINVSAAFFLSIEFQETGYFVYRAYQAAFGRRVQDVVPLTFQEFLPDTRRVSQGVVVGPGDWQRQLELNKQAFLDEFMARPAFSMRYPAALGDAQFVDQLNANTGGSLTQAQRDDLVTRLGAGAVSRVQALREIVENASFRQRELNRAFVLMEYFGYLRRNSNDAPDADFSGLTFWLAKLEQFGGDFRSAEMVKAFLDSTEYQRRFGQ